MASTLKEKLSISMAGEYAVAAELFRRGVHAAVTFGNHKTSDIIASVVPERRDGRVIVVEVKATIKSQWPVSDMVARATAAFRNVFWVFVWFPAPLERKSGPELEERRAQSVPHFYVLTSQEVASLLRAERKAYRRRYFRKHRRVPGRGVPSVKRASVRRHESAWHKILKRLEVG